MTLRLIQGPSLPVVETREALNHLRCDNSEETHLVDGLIDAAIGEVDGPDGLLSRALVTQTWQLLVRCFPPVIELPLPPLQAVTVVEYLDSSGALQTLSSESYVVSGIGGSGKGELSCARGCNWPAVVDHPEAIRITFRAGYGDPEQVPAPIRAAILETVASRYAFRESITPAAQYFALPRSAQAALENYRVRAF